MISGAPISGAAISSLDVLAAAVDTAPTLSWQPRYPDQPRWVNHRYFDPFVSRQNLVPIPNPAPPTELTWQPFYPASGRPRAQQHLLRIAGHQAVALWLGPASVTTALAWLPHYPSRPGKARPPMFRRMAYTSAPPSTQPAIAGYGWRPTYPSKMPPHRPPRQGWSVSPVSAQTILSAVGCIIFTDERATTPTLLDAQVTAATFLDEQLTVPTFLTEGFC